MTEEEEKKAKQIIALAMLPEELLANALPSVIWVDSCPCDLRITRRKTIYHVEYVEYDCDGESVKIETEYQSMKIAIVRMLVKLMDMDEEYMLTYDDEVHGREGHKQKFKLALET